MPYVHRLHQNRPRPAVARILGRLKLLATATIAAVVLPAALAAAASSLSAAYCGSARAVTTSRPFSDG